MQNFEKGIQAEKKAIEILKKRGFEIIGHRIKSSFGEIDILAKFDQSFYIVEVKYRKNLDIASYAINKQQLNRSLKTFFTYMEKVSLNYEQIYFLGFIINGKEYKIINITDFEEN